MNTAILFLHISGALVLGVFVFLALVVMLQNKASFYTKLSYILSGGLIVQVITGTLLELTSAHPAVFILFCSKILLYVGIVLGTQALLVVKMLKLQMRVSYKHMIYTSLATFAALLTTGLIVQ